MLSLLKARRNAASEPKKRSFMKQIEHDAKRRASDRQEIHSSIQALKRDAHLLTSFRRSRKKEERSKRKARLSQKELEKAQFKTWIRYRNPNLNRSIEQATSRRKLLREWFGFLDADGSGEISREELGVPLISLGLAADMVAVDRLIDSVDQVRFHEKSIFTNANWIFFSVSHNLSLFFVSFFLLLFVF
jgi:hypothetical protein